MPSRTPQAAQEAFLGPLRQALSCVTRAQLYASPRAPGRPQALALSDNPVQLTSSVVPGGLQLRITHSYQLIPDDSTGWQVSTVAYHYNLADQHGRELLAWHWHPIGPSTTLAPHLHVAGSAVPKRAHLPTGRVSIESVLRLLLTDLGVPPRPEHARDYLDVLAESEHVFLAHRRWSG